MTTTPKPSAHEFNEPEPFRTSAIDKFFDYIGAMNYPFKADLKRIFTILVQPLEDRIKELEEDKSRLESALEWIDDVATSESYGEGGDDAETRFKDVKQEVKDALKSTVCNECGEYVSKGETCFSCSYTKHKL